MNPTATDVFFEAVKLIESKSIKVWATLPVNKKAWITHIQSLHDAGKTIDPVRLSAYMVCVAIGA